MRREFQFLGGPSGIAKNEVEHALPCLERVPEHISELNKILTDILIESDARLAEHKLRGIARSIPEMADVPHFTQVRAHLVNAMAEVGQSGHNR